MPVKVVEVGALLVAGADTDSSGSEPAASAPERGEEDTDNANTKDLLVRLKNAGCSA